MLKWIIEILKEFYHQLKLLGLYIWKQFKIACEAIYEFLNDLWFFLCDHVVPYVYTNAKLLLKYIIKVLSYSYDDMSVQVLIWWQYVVDNIPGWYKNVKIMLNSMWYTFSCWVLRCWNRFLDFASDAYDKYSEDPMLLWLDLKIFCIEYQNEIYGVLFAIFVILYILMIVFGDRDH